MNNCLQACDPTTHGGIQWWAQHPLLSNPGLSEILQQINPDAAQCLSPILAWTDNASMREHWDALTHFIDSKIPSDVPLSFEQKNRYIQEKIQESIAEFSQPRAEFDHQSVALIVKKLITDLAGNDFALKTSAGQKLFQTLGWSLFLQDVADNPRYTPHDYRHALIVARWMATLASAEPALLETFTQRYACTAKQALALLQLVGLMHDCGYPFIEDQAESSRASEPLGGQAPVRQGGLRGLTKATHAPVGGLMFHVLVKPALTELLAESGVSAGATVCREMVRAIHLHSSDDPSNTSDKAMQLSTEGGGIYQVFDERQLLAVTKRLAELGDPVRRVKLQSPDAHQLERVQAMLPSTTRVSATSGVLPPGRALDWQHPGDRALATPCVKVDRQQIPMAYLVMLADNLDMTRARLGKVQGSSVYGQALVKFHQLSYHDPEALQANLNALGETVKTFYDQRMQYPDQNQWPNCPESVIVNICASSKKDIDFLAGLLSVAEVSLATRDEGETIVVQLQPLPTWLKAQALPMDDVAKQMRFHVDRLEHALKFLVDAPRVEVRWPDRLFSEAADNAAMGSTESSRVA